MSPVVYAISDLHGNLPDIPTDAEVLILAGDICPDFRPAITGERVDKGGYAQARWLDTEFRAWLESRPDGCSVVAIWGNHDFVGEHPELIPDLPWILLQDSSTLLNADLCVYGTPWVPGLPYWAFHASEFALSARAGALPQVDILVTHGPPRGLGDYIPGGTPKQVNKYGNAEGLHVGDVALSSFLESERAPGVVVCGHIHEARGVYCTGGTTVYNVAAVDERYHLHSNPWVRIF